MRLARIAQLADDVDLASGKTPTKEGSRGREFFVLLEGSADVQRHRQRIATMHGGDFFPVHALVITDRDFRRLRRDSQAIQGEVLDAVASRLSHPL